MDTHVDYAVWGPLEEMVALIVPLLVGMWSGSTGPLVRWKLIGNRLAILGRCLR